MESFHVWDQLYLITDKNAEAQYGFTPLHVCAKFNGVEATKVLIKHGANINARDCKQKTPLHVAARRGNVAFIKVKKLSQSYPAHVVFYTFMPKKEWPEEKKLGLG